MKGVKGFQKGHPFYLTKEQCIENGKKISAIMIARNSNNGNGWKKGHGRYRSDESYRVSGAKISQTLTGKPQPWSRGERNNMWKGGITPINAAIRTSI